jgi:NAD(P)-dependent dehydrogenase (short-subunit alcohol dehydrogenase family)
MGAYDVSGKVALVTGAARGIGFETAKALHERGASVTLVDLSAQETDAAAARIGSERTLALAADVRDEAALEAAVAATVDRFGGLDVAVANAGIAPTPATMRSMPAEEFRRVIDVDLHGAVHTARAALEQVVERRGQIVLVASIYAFTNGVLNSPYAIAKAGVEQLGRALRVELHQDGASASVAYFGFIDTKMVDEAYESPITLQVDKSIPFPLRKKLPPSAAAAAIVRGIEGRKAQIIAPKRWRVLAVLRGITGPTSDALMLREPNLQDALRKADGAALSPTRRDPPA